VGEKIKYYFIFFLYSIKKMKKSTAKILSSLLIPLVKVWAVTLRIERKNYDFFLSTREMGKGVLYAIWHDELFVPICAHQHESVVALVSESGDGEIIARILCSMGFLTVRGSSTRGGLKALKGILRLLQEEGREVTITVDGPRGPRHRVKEGIVYLAAKAQVPIMPIRVQISHKKVFKRSWDKFQLPLPGARCKIIYGRPYWCKTRRITSSFIKEQIRILEKKMEELIHHNQNAFKKDRER